MKKRLYLILICLIAIALIGCNKKTDEPATPTSAPTEAVAPTDTPAPTDEPAAPTPTDEPVVTEEPAELPDLENLALKDIFAEHGLKVGTCLSPVMLFNSNYKDLINSQFTSITMENHMKPDSILDKEASKAAGDIVVNFGDDTIKILEFAKANGLKMRGHTIIWHSQTPNWIFYKNFTPSDGLCDRDEMLARMESFIRQVFEKLEELGYIDLFYAYDVANECWMEDGSMRDSNWRQTIGDDYLWYAFSYADKYAPESIDLYYNDYNEQFKTETLYDFVNTLVDDEGNYLIDGVGFQAHLYTKDNLISYFRTVDKIASTGLKVELTELDVCLGAYMKQLEPTEENLAAQGRFTYDLINGLFKRIDEGTLNMDAITFWGFTDSLSWRKEYSPLLYDGDMAPKPMYYGAAQIKEMSGYTE